MDACDPTIQLCDAIPMDLPVNGTNATTSFLATASKVGLPLVGAVQLSASLVTLMGSSSDSADQYLFYQSILNGVFGSAGVALGLIKPMLGKGKAPEEEAPAEEAPVEGETPMLRQAEEAPVEGEAEEEALVEEPKAPGMPISTLVSLLGLVSGSSTLGLYFVADDADYTDTEKYLNLAASGLAIALGTVTLLDYLGSKPEQPEEEAPEEPAAEAEEVALL